MRRRALTALALLAAALLPLASAWADDPAPPPKTPEEAQARWQDRCGTRMVRPGVPEAGSAAIATLLKLGVAPDEAETLVERAAFSRDMGAGKIADWAGALEKEAQSATLSAEALAEKAWAALGKKRPAREAGPPPKEAAGVRRFAAGEGPPCNAAHVRWQGGDVERASALADPDPDAPAEMPPGPAWISFAPLSAEQAKALGLGDGSKAPEVARYVVLFMKDAVTWWAAELDDFFAGKHQRFTAGFVVGPTGDEARFVLVDPAKRLGWRAVYVLADVGGKRVLLPPGSVRFERGAPPAAEKGEVRASLGDPSR